MTLAGTLVSAAGNKLTYYLPSQNYIAPVWFGQFGQGNSGKTQKKIIYYS